MKSNLLLTLGESDRQDLYVAAIKGIAAICTGRAEDSGLDGSDAKTAFDEFANVLHLLREVDRSI